MPVINFPVDSGLDPLVGTYEATLTELKYGTSKAGQPKLDFVFTLTDSEVEGRKAFTSKSLQPNAIWSTKEALVALGMEPEALSGTDVDTDDITAQVVGNSCRVVLSRGEYNGKPTQQVDKVLSQYDLG